MSQTNAVEYILSMKSGQFDSALDKSTNKVSALEGAMKGITGTIGTMIGAFAAFSFLEGSVTAWDESEQALAQLQATMKSTGGAVGVTTDAMVEQAKALQGLTTFDDDAVIGMQSVLATFKDIKGEIFTGAVPAILDLSQKFNQDLKSSAIQVGKALNDPIQGVAALRKIGVGFTDDQQKMIKSLVETNRMADAQALILNELKSQIGGSAEAAALAGTGPFKQLQNEFGDVREEIGALTVDIGRELLPALKSLVSGLSSFVKAVREGTPEVYALAAAGGVLAVGIRVVIPLLEGFGIAATTALGPLAALAAGVYLLVDAYATMAQTERDWQMAREGFDKKLASNQKAALMQDVELYKKQGLSEELSYRKAINAEYESLIALNQSLKDKFAKAGSNEERNQLIEQMDQAKKEMASLEALKSEGIGALRQPSASQTMKPASTAAARTPRGSTKSQATGSKAVTINVSIGDLVKTLNVNTTNLVDGAQKIKEQVTAVLMSAVNDFQIVADR